MTAQTKISGAWKDVSAVSTKVSGAWKDVSEGYTKISGAWKQFLAPAAAGSFDLLETEILTGTQSSIEFTSLSSYASDYQHLQLRYTFRTAVAGTSDTIFAQFNSDTGSNYSWHRIWGDGSSVNSSSGTTQTTMRLAVSAGNTSTASSFGAGVTDIWDAFNSSKYTTMRGLNGITSATFVFLWSGNWRNTSSLTSIKIFPSGSLLAGTRVSLYGWKGA